MANHSVDLGELGAAAGRVGLDVWVRQAGSKDLTLIGTVG